MEFIELTIKINNSSGFEQDLMAFELGEIGFDSFEYTDNGLKAYCPVTVFDEKKIDDLNKAHIKDIPFSYSFKLIPDQNWNEIWEKNYFSPIVIGNECVIHSSFHQQVPKAKYDILIDPKMSFGTGHHETTILMVTLLLQMDVKGHSVLDMGCGTGILAILAAMKGASSVTAIDIDEWSFNNTIENIVQNGYSSIQVEHGGAELLTGRNFDVILANINRNILLADMKHYAACLKPGKLLLMSGFYDIDRPAINDEAQKLNLKEVRHEEMNHWIATLYEKL